MKHLAQRFWSAEQGQDLTEYSLLLAFVVLTAAGIFMANGTSLQGIWISTNTLVNQAAVKAHASVS
jgi:Flp pilus assembly pilin Flp